MAWNIAYLGNDIGLVEKLSEGFKHHFPSDEIKITTYSGKTEQEIQGLIKTVAEVKPHLILIDFEEDNHFFLHLCRILKRTNSTKRIPQVGLFELLSTDFFVSESQLAGAMVHHRKGSDCYQILYSCMAILQPDKIFEHGFATAKPTDTVWGHHFVKVGKISPESIHMESNFDFNLNQTVLIETYWNKLNCIPSREFEVFEKSEGGAYYDTKFTYNFKFHFVDQIPKDNQQMTPEMLMALESKRGMAISQVKGQFAKWFKDNFNDSLPKNVKVLVVDRDLLVYQNRQRSDLYSFVLRAQPYLQDIKQEISKLKPHIIIFNFDNNPKALDLARIKEMPNPEYPNGPETVELMLQYIQPDKNYRPYIILFNAPQITEHEIKNVFKYERMINYPHEFEPEIMEKLVNSFVKKFDADQPIGATEQIFYAKKFDPSSTAEILIPINLVSISECDVIFTSEAPLEYYTSFKVFLPIPLYLTIVPSKKADPTKGLYRALINGPGDDHLKELRHYINSIFFRNKDAQKKAEKDAFEKLNQKVQEEREKKETKP